MRISSRNVSLSRQGIFVAFVKALVCLLLVAGCLAEGNCGELPGFAAVQEKGKPVQINSSGKARGDSTETKAMRAERSDSPMGNSAFAVSLYSALSAREGNLSFSPASLSSVLALAYEGARGTTRQEMANALQFPLDEKQFHRALSMEYSVPASESIGKGITLSQVNALWGQKGYHFLKAFLNDLKRYHSSGIRQVDFEGNVEDSRKIINGWVEDNTKGIIKDLIKQGVLKTDTRIVLTNAIYFKGMWDSPFPKNNTRDGDFRVNHHQTVKTLMMEQTGDFRYLESQGVKALDLPYTGKALSMIVILPGDDAPLSGVDALLNSSGLDKLVNDLGRAGVVRVHVKLPKFKVSSEFDLAATFSRMGMAQAFGGDADFSGMTGSKGFFIGNVIHKAYVDVNEEGTEAAAASAVVMMKAVLRSREFIADRAFLFIVRDKRTGSILFMGRLTDPKA